MINIEVNNDIKLIQIQEDYYKELFNLVDKNREYLKKTLPWLDYTKREEDSLKFIKSSIERYKNNDELELGIFENKKLIGMIGTHALNKEEKHLSIGYWIDESYQGKGIMTLCCKKLIEYTFLSFDINDIFIKCGITNFKSCSIPERLGFKYIKVLENFENLYGKSVDMKLYKLNKHYN